MNICHCSYLNIKVGRYLVVTDKVNKIKNCRGKHCFLTLYL